MTNGFVAKSKKKKKKHDKYSFFFFQNLFILLYSNTVNRFGHSSFYIGRYIASQGKTVEEKYFVSHHAFILLD
jgi:hypothetical protein